MLELPVPIIQAPMAGVSTPELAAAVSNGGGLGSLGLGSSTVDDALRQITETRYLTDKPFNVNLFCHEPPTSDASDEASWIRWMSPLIMDAGLDPPDTLATIYTSFIENEAMFEMLLMARPAVVSFHFGLPKTEWIRAFQAQDALVLATATSVSSAKAIQRAGVDVVIAQGFQAGGHRGIEDPDGPDDEIGTHTLVEALLSAVDIPVVAAGGIMDGASIRSMLEIGACAVQMGTAFLLCPEANVPEEHRELLRTGSEPTTVMTRSISGRPARGFPGPISRRAAMDGAPIVPPYPLPYDLTRQLNAAARRTGKSAYGGFWAGSGFDKIREMPAKELVRLLNAEIES